MITHALLQPAAVAFLALIPTTMDRIVVWGAVALVLCVMAWREYTLPALSPPYPAPDLQSATQHRPAAEVDEPVT